METLLFVLLIAAAGLACPAMMWWQRRRGRDPACCARGSRQSGERHEEPGADLAELRVRHDRLAARIAELETAEQPDATPSAR